MGVAVYAAPSGEPALGPVAFMHRPSAMDDPMAPLGHHWQDATHISYGVLTLGVFGARWKLEGSAFNGREPDDHRWNFDRIRLDSYSGRVTVNPDSSWSLTAGYGFLKSPEAHAPEESAHRVTASAMYGKALGREGQLAATVVYGVNRMGGGSEPPEWSHTFLAESEVILDRHNTVFGRVEWVREDRGGSRAAGLGSPSALSPGESVAWRDPRAGPRPGADAWIRDSRHGQPSAPVAGAVLWLTHAGGRHDFSPGPPVSSTQG